MHVQSFKETHPMKHFTASLYKKQHWNSILGAQSIKGLLTCVKDNSNIPDGVKISCGVSLSVHVLVETSVYEK